MNLSLADANPVDSNRLSIDDLPSNGLFPLPLTPFELFVVHDEKRDCPITSFIELHFSGPMQREILQAALHHTVHQHPLLASRLIEQDGILSWDYDPDFSPELFDPQDVPILERTDDGNEKKQVGPRRLDLFSDPGCRYWYEERPEGKSRLTIQLHHAACDGVGLRRVLIDTLLAYAEHTTPESEVDPEWESAKMVKRRKREEPIAERLLERGDFSAIKEKPPATKRSRWKKLRNAYYFHFQRPQPLLADRKILRRETLDPLNEPLRHHLFDSATSSRLQQHCRDENVSLNDLSLAALFRACYRWNRMVGIRKDNTRIRLLMPFDLRGRSDLQMPATNRLSFSFLGRTHKQCNDRDDLLASVWDETQWIKATRVHLDFLDGLAALASRPTWLKRALHRKASRNMSTSVLTYTGDITRGMKSYFPEVDGRRRIGDTLLENILIAPPTRENTNITLGVCINWGQICVSANWNRNILSAEDCNAFLQIFAQEMKLFCSNP